jgi:hypothetical protein
MLRVIIALSVFASGIIVFIIEVNIKFIDIIDKVFVEYLLFKPIVRYEIANDFFKDLFIIISLTFFFTALFNFNENAQPIFQSVTEIFFVNFVLEKF